MSLRRSERHMPMAQREASSDQGMAFTAVGYEASSLRPIVYA